MIISPSSTGLRGAEDVKVGHEIVKVGEFQSSLGCGLSL
jgi:hypothetical protein